MPSTTLVFPTLLDAPASLRRAAVERLPIASRLLAGAGCADTLGCGFWGWLCGELALARQDDWPLAPVWAARDGLPADSGYWLAALPVSLDVGRDDIRLTLEDPVPDAGESAQLLRTLNHHFDADGLAFVGAASGRWYLRQALPARIVTAPPECGRGRSVRPCQPHGADAGTWRRRQNEIQMLLHEHPVNEARAARGEAAINSVWLWAGGTLPRAGSATALTLCTDRADVGALAEFAGAKVSALSAAGGQRRGERMVVVLDSTAGADEAAEASLRMVVASSPPTELVFCGAARTVAVHGRGATLGQRLGARLRRTDVEGLLLRHGVTEAHES